MRIALIVPPTDNMAKYIQGWQLSSADYGTFPPLGLLYIASFLKMKIPNTEVKIIDCPSKRIDYSMLEKILRTFKPAVVGITAFSVCLVDVLKVARIVKSQDKNMHICIGGPHNFIFPRQTLEYPDVDSIVVGEGELVFTELIKQLQNGQTIEGINGLYVKSDLNNNNFERVIIKDINILPIFDINFIRGNSYCSTVGRYRNIITLLSSRGCPYNCTFCDSPYKVFRGRKIDNILNEIILRLNQGFKEIFFYDDTFNIFPQRVIDLSQKIINANIKLCWSFRGRVDTVTFEMLEIAKQAGCERVHFGIETGTDEGLQELKKGITTEQIRNTLSWCRQLKIKTIADFIIGLPFEKSREDVVKNIERLVAFSPDYAQFNILQPMPGSEIYKLGVEQGIIDSSKWEDFVRSPRAGFEPPIWDQHLDSTELAELIYFAYRKFYVRPGYIARNLVSIRTFNELKRTFKGGIKIFFKN